MSNIRCTFPGCKKALTAESMWLPERKARSAANGNRRVALADFPNFAHCGYHGHQLRQTGVKVYRYLEEVKYEEAELARRAAEEAKLKAHAQRFYVKQGLWAKSAPRDGTPRVGGGLSRYVNKKVETPSETEPKPEG
jgi:hypothetical protein